MAVSGYVVGESLQDILAFVRRATGAISSLV